MADEPSPDLEEDDAGDSADVRELACFQRGGIVRVYTLRAIDGGAELWRVTEAPGAPPVSVLETTFRSSDEALQFLEELERTLRAGGWIAV